MRAVALIVAPALAVLIGVGAYMAAAGSAAGPSRTVQCSEIILTGKFPHPGYRRVLGVVSAPPAYLPQVAPSMKQEWPFWRKAGLVVWGRAPVVTVSIPEAWRSRVAITWGNRPGFYSSLRIAGCGWPLGARRGRAYAGGFYLKEPAACLPLVFRVGRRQATVRFGLGQPCPNASGADIDAPGNRRGN